MYQDSIADLAAGVAGYMAAEAMIGQVLEFIGTIAEDAAPALIF